MEPSGSKDMGTELNAVLHRDWLHLQAVAELSRNRGSTHRLGLNQSQVKRGKSFGSTTSFHGPLALSQAGLGVLSNDVLPKGTGTSHLRDMNAVALEINRVERNREELRLVSVENPQEVRFPEGSEGPHLLETLLTLGKG
eukprot:6481020-Amphidinium_carterae.2